MARSGGFLVLAVLWVGLFLVLARLFLEVARRLPAAL